MGSVGVTSVGRNASKAASTSGLGLGQLVQAGSSASERMATGIAQEGRNIGARYSGFPATSLHEAQNLARVDLFAKADHGPIFWKNRVATIQ